MIHEMLVKHSEGKTQVTVYPRKHDSHNRSHNPTKSSLRRLERVMPKLNVEPYFKENGIVVWITR